MHAWGQSVLITSRFDYNDKSILLDMKLHDSESSLPTTDTGIWVLVYLNVTVTSQLGGGDGGAGGKGEVGGCGCEKTNFDALKMRKSNTI